MTSHQINTFKPIYNKDSKILILGSHPSLKSKEVGFYYGNKKNRFWAVLSAILNEDFININSDEKIELLLKHNIALCDVAKECDIYMSSDATMKKIVPNDNIEKIFSSCNIEKVLLNGKTAYYNFLKYFSKYSKSAFCMPSTSPANAVKSLDELISDWKILNELV